MRASSVKCTNIFFTRSQSRYGPSGFLSRQLHSDRSKVVLENMSLVSENRYIPKDCYPSYQVAASSLEQYSVAAALNSTNQTLEIP
uniref:Uncharacterized protein n=1 Tax=Tetraselmis sp. GSL018 TaxID=582737 RepID=A0A061R7Z5_9CHLO